MRHNKKGRKLGTDASHTKAMKRSLVGSLFANDRIKTIESRAKEIRPDVDHIITWAKKGDLHSRRLAIAALGDKDLVREIFEKVEQGMFKGRDGGYTRILKLGPRKGDNAPMVIMELVNEGVRKKKSESAEAAKPKRTTPSRRRVRRTEEPAADASAEGVEALGAESAEEVADAVAPVEETHREEAEEARSEELAKESADEAEAEAAADAEAAEAAEEEHDKPE